jgi:hypothetical protein
VGIGAGRGHLLQGLEPASSGLFSWGAPDRIVLIAQGKEKQMKINAFHTKNLEEGAGHRNVYHDNSQCSDGKRIKSQNRDSGTDGRPKCDECKTLS